MTDWLDANAVRARRGGHVRKARAFLAALDGVWPRVRTVRSKRGRPHREVHAQDYERLVRGLGPPPEAREAIAA